MAFTQTQIDALEVHIARGATRVDYGDRSVTYGSIEEMVKLLGVMKADLATQNPATAPHRRSFATFSRR